MRKPSRRRGGSLAVYVTSHGFGHLHRTAAVINRVPDDIPVTIRSHPDLFEQWRQRLLRPAELASYVSDAGVVGPPGDSAATDGPSTLRLAAQLHAEAMERLDDEVRLLRDAGTAAVLCDAPAVPLVAARRAGMGGFLLANFTWADIYAPYVRAASGEGAPLIAALRRAYRHATAAFRVEPALRMSWLRPQIEAGMVVNQARDRGADLRRLLSRPKTDKLVYLYLGRYGQSDLAWHRLEQFAARGIHFVSYHPAPSGEIENMHVVPSADWPGGDLVASCDAVVAKAGYGTVTEAMARGTPIIYPPRRGFAEFRALDRALRTWGGGVPVSERDFRALRLEHALGRALALVPGPPPYATDGAARIAAHLTALCRPEQLRRGGVTRRTETGRKTC
jgi:hypothetical protein